MLTRRRFVQGMGGGVILSTSGLPLLASVPARGELAGPHFDLTIDTLPVNFTGRARTAIAINGQVPGPTLRMRQDGARTGAPRAERYVAVGREWVRVARLSADPGFYLNVDACAAEALALEPDHVPALEDQRP